MHRRYLPNGVFGPLSKLKADSSRFGSFSCNENVLIVCESKKTLLSETGERRNAATWSICAYVVGLRWVSNTQLGWSDVKALTGHESLPHESDDAVI